MSMQRWKPIDEANVLHDGIRAAGTTSTGGLMAESANEAFRNEAAATNVVGEISSRGVRYSSGA